MPCLKLETLTITRIQEGLSHICPPEQLVRDSTHQGFDETSMILQELRTFRTYHDVYHTRVPSRKGELNSQRMANHRALDHRGAAASGSFSVPQWSHQPPSEYHWVPSPEEHEPAKEHLKLANVAIAVNQHLVDQELDCWTCRWWHVESHVTLKFTHAVSRFECCNVALVLVFRDWISPLPTSEDGLSTP